MQIHRHRNQTNHTESSQGRASQSHNNLSNIKTAKRELKRQLPTKICSQQDSCELSEEQKDGRKQIMGSTLQCLHKVA